MREENRFEEIKIASSQFLEEKEFWINKLSGELNKSFFPYDSTNGINKCNRDGYILGNTLTFKFDQGLFQQMIKISRGSDPQLHMILVAILSLLLGRYANNKDIILGTTIDRQQLAGEPVNTVLPLRTQLNDDMTVKELLVHTRQTINEAIRNQNYPVEVLVYDDLGMKRGNEFPLFDVMVLLENIQDKEYTRDIPVNLIFDFFRADDYIEGTIHYNSSRYRKETIESIISHFTCLLEQSLFNPDTPVSALEMMSGKEKETLLVDFNNNHADIPMNTTIYHYIEQQAENKPGETAVICGNKKLTYEELNQRANQLARVLKDAGIGTDQVVGLLMDRSLVMIECILATWKAGGAYIPIFPQDPLQRTIGILEDSRTPVVIVGEAYSNSRLSDLYKGTIIVMDESGTRGITDRDSGNLDLDLDMNSLAYVIYTSGSTGKPKGAMVEHIGMMNHIHAKIHDLRLNNTSILAQNASHTFDISVWQFFAALINGGKTVIYPDEFVLETDQLMTAVDEDNVTVLEVVPSYLSVMLELLGSHSRKFDSLRYLLVTGEPVKFLLVKKWFEMYPRVKMVNAYGPTEASDDITHHIMEQAPEKGPIPIGKPLRNLNIYIVDEKMNPCPLGIKGEICVSGIGVGRGYLNDRKKTDLVFQENPFIEEKGVRLYKTGDLGCWRSNGIIEFFGRKDYQVKIRGFRIECGEIENHLITHPHVKEAVVTDKEDKEGNKYLCAYLVPVNREKCDAHDIKTYLSDRLPDYMVPAHVVELEKIPLSPNGKVDRGALPEPVIDKSFALPYITGKMLGDVILQPRSRTKDTDLFSENEIPREILSEEEKDKILYTFNDTKKEYPRDKLIHQVFEARVKSAPHRVALVYEDKQVTYGHLNARANQLARTLMAKGVKADQVVGLMVGRSLEMITGILAILKAGAAYLPIGTEYPAERVRYMLEDCSTSLMLTDTGKNSTADSSSSPDIVDMIDINDEGNYKYKGDSADFSSPASPDNLAYVIYTSGTTGTPKGVMIEHKPMLNFIKGMTDLIDYKESDNILSLITISFDIFALETFVPLSAGSRVVIGSQDAQANPAKAGMVMETEHITMFQATPSMLQLMIADETAAHGLKSLRYLLVGGEAFPPTLLEEARKITHSQVYNLYGPTETTVWSTACDLTDPEDITIGKPIANTWIYILNQGGQLQPPGAVGELCIGGEGLARGYMKKEELTAEKFVPDPYVKGKRIYRTGDLARWLPDGNIQFMGRVDHQVKIKGFRIELGEIENLLLAHKDVKEAVVVVKENQEGEKCLCAHVVSDKQLTEAGLREFLARELPLYMLPSHFVQLEKVPLTISGKANRKLLEALEVNVKSSFAAAENKTQEILASVWAEVLGVEEVGIDDNYFSLGGDSIRAIQISARLQKHGLKMEMKNLFEYPTIKELSQFLPVIERPVDQSPIEGNVCLTQSQKWFFEQGYTELHHFNHSIILHSPEGFRRELVEKVFHKLAQHHDTLRMVFEIEGNDIKQKNRGISASLIDFDVFDLEEHAMFKQIIEEKSGEIQTSIDLKKGPLIKLRLFKTQTGDYLLIVIHHLVLDGVSWRILFEDLSTAYQQLLAGKDHLQLPLKTTSYKEWAEKLSEYATSDRLLAELPYWKALEQKHFPPFARDYVSRENKMKDSQWGNFELSTEYTGKLLREVNRAYNTEINDILLAALALALKDWCGIDRALVDLEGHGREEILEGVNITRTIGWFTSLYPVGLEVEAEKDIPAMVKNTKEMLRNIPNKGIGYGILKYLTPGDKKQGVKFDLEPEISFNYLGQFDGDINTSVFQVANIPAGHSISPNAPRIYTLNIMGIITGKKLRISVGYSKHEYDEQTISEFTRSYRDSLEKIIEYCVEKEDAELTVSDLSSSDFSEQEVDLIYNELEGTFSN